MKLSESHPPSSNKDTLLSRVRGNVTPGIETLRRPLNITRVWLRVRAPPGLFLCVVQKQPSFPTRIEVSESTRATTEKVVMFRSAAASREGLEKITRGLKM